MNLAIDIGQADIIIIHQGDPPYPGPAERFCGITSDAADAADQHMAATKPFQPDLADQQFGSRQTVQCHDFRPPAVSVTIPSSNLPSVSRQRSQPNEFCSVSTMAQSSSRRRTLNVCLTVSAFTSDTPGCWNIW